ncbi:ankyrin, partial [Schizophyllum commune Loenen D]
MDSHLRLARVLLDAGANIDSRTNSGSTPLHYAAQGRHLDVVRELINRGADVHARRIKDGSIPLHLAVAEPSLRADARGSERATPSHFVALEKLREVIRMLIEHGADPNTRDNQGFTLLHTAVYCGQEDLIDLLLRAGAVGDARNIRGMTPLRCAL